MANIFKASYWCWTKTVLDGRWWYGCYDCRDESKRDGKYVFRKWMDLGAA